MSIWIQNAKIATMDSANPLAESAVVVGGFFAFVGSLQNAEAYLQEHPCPDISVLDCGGEFLMPGFNDSHMHYLHYAKSKSSVDLTGCTALSEVILRMRRGFEQSYRPDSGLWLIGEGWNQDYFTDEKRFPTADDLNEITTEYPLLIMRSCFHIGVLNQKAMELYGISADTASRFGACVETDARGIPNGVVKEEVLDDIKSFLPAPSAQQLMDLLVDTQADLFRNGITSVQSDDLKYMPADSVYTILSLLREAGETGRLRLRIAEQALLPQKSELDQFLYEKGIDDSYGNRTFKISCIKLLADGSLGARTALMRKPYHDAPDTKGLAVYDQASLDALVLEAHKNNIAVAIHAIGDGAIELCLNAFARARQEYPYLHPRHGIVHCQITDAKQLRRFKELDVLAYIQPIFLDYDIHIVTDRVGRELASTSYAWKTYIDSGVHTAFGTDCPVESFRPLPGIYCAVTRCDLKGNGPFLAEQRLTREQALYGYTAAGAYASHDEAVKGKIKAGMYADFITLDTDLLTCPAEALLHANVTRTYIDGTCVYDNVQR